MLASLQVSAITTNYDDLYEQAVASTHEDTHETVLRLPWDAAELATRPLAFRADHPRLVKMHGCVTKPASIVLTRADYMRYEDERRALRGMLHQALIGNPNRCGASRRRSDVLADA